MPDTSSAKQTSGPGASVRQARQGRWQLVAALAFACALSAPMLGQLFALVQTADLEIATAPWLGLSDIPASLHALDRWIERDFGFRAQLISLNAAVRELLGASAARDVLIGRDGWLFDRGNHSLEQHRGIENFRGGA